VWRRATPAHNIHGREEAPTMKQQISRFSLHQNAKVFAVLMAVSSLVFLIPVFLIFAAIAPAQARPPMVMFLVMPVMYLLVGYVMVAIGCAIYNFMFQYIGGVEFESTGDRS
jgi:hypothetical protein